MSSALDLELMSLSLEEEDIPFELPNNPDSCSIQRYSLSLVGRILNPRCQRVANVIRDMPRIWQKQGKVYGIALSPERFQFFFQSEYDLEDVLDKGLHSHNLWALVLERWFEVPPVDYLQFALIWVRLRNIPMNHYSERDIEALGSIVGEVKIVAFKPGVQQLNDYERVQVKFDVSKPLRRSKVIKLPNGGSTTIYFEYERTQKRCHCCQRMTHEKEFCPIFTNQSPLRRSSEVGSRAQFLDPRSSPLSASDPLFGVLSNDQVGIDPHTGRRQIAPEVLKEMRMYLLGAKEEEKKVREERVKISVTDALQDPASAQFSLRLETPTVFTADMDRGKGKVFSFRGDVKERLSSKGSDQSSKFMSSSTRAFFSSAPTPRYKPDCFYGSDDELSPDCPTVVGVEAFVSPVSGMDLGDSSSRKRPSKRTRKKRTDIDPTPVTHSRSRDLGPRVVLSKRSTRPQGGKGVVGSKQKRVVTKLAMETDNRVETNKKAVIPFMGSLNSR